MQLADQNISDNIRLLVNFFKHKMFVAHFTQCYRFPRKCFYFHRNFHTVRINQSHFFWSQSNDFIIVQIHRLICVFDNCRNVRCSIKFAFPDSHQQWSISFCRNDCVFIVIMKNAKGISTFQLLCCKSYSLR